MSTLLIKRAQRAMLFSMVALLSASLLAPMAAVANTDLVIGDTAIVNNPAGAYLRSDVTVVDDSTISAELPDGATVYVQDGPFFTDTGVWVWVASDGFGPGYISTDLLQKIGTEEFAEANGVVAEEPVAEEPVAEEPAVSELSWLEPIDSLVVVDYNAELPSEGLAIRSWAGLDAPVLGYAPVGTGLDVTSSREWVGDISFVRVNWGGAGAYVDGRYVELSSEAVVVEEPTEEVIWLDEPIAEEPVVEEPVVEAPAVEEPVVEAPVVEEPVVEEPVVEEPVVEEPVVETPVVEEPVVEEPATEIPTEVVGTPDSNVATEEVVTETEVPVTEAVVEATATEVVVTETVMPDTEPAVEETATEVVVTETVVPDTQPAVEETATEVVVTETVVPDTEPAVTETEAPVTQPATEVVAATATTEVTPAPTATVAATVAPATEAPATEAAATETEAPVVTVEPTATQAATEVAAPVAPQPIASTALSFNADAMIGSATVTGTNNGLLCRVDPNPAAPVLMTLAEGTKVLVSAEPVNGYLGIDCGGLQGFADVNYLWSGGAGDEEITASKMNVVVTGTGNGLNCRTGAGLSHSVITTIFDGTSLVTRGKASNGWTPVTCAGQNGFVSTTWIEVSGSSNTGAAADAGSTAASGTAVVNTGGDGLYCRTGAGTSYGVITVLSHGSSVPVRGANQGEWVPVTCGGSAGFAHSSFLNVSAASAPSTPGAPSTSAPSGTVTVANTGGQGLNCRTGAGTGNSIITTLALGQSVQTRSGSVNGWTAVICGGTNGFVSSEFVSGGSASTPTTPSTPDAGNVSGATGKATVNTGGDGLYCRSGAGTSNGVITVLGHGTVVATRGAASNGWVPVTCGGQSGWAHADYLTIGSTGTTPTTPAPPAPTNPPALVSGNNAQITEAVSMRYSGSQSASVVTTVEAGVVVKITGSLSNSYYPVDYDGLKGFIHQDYLVKTSAALSERGGSGTPDTPAPSQPDSGSTSPTGNAMVNYAMRYLGYPYVWATHGPASFDCSGFTYWVTLNVTGKNIGAGTWTQVSAGTPVSKANLQPGDLVFFQNTYTAGLSHVGLYIGNGQFIHAQNEATGVVISDLDSSYYGPRWYGAVRI